MIISQALQSQRSLPNSVWQVSIVIPVFNKVAFTQQCIESLEKTISQNIGFEVIVVNNASTDDTSKFLDAASQQRSWLKTISLESNQGFARACNLGAQAANFEYLLLLNNDTQALPNWLNPLLEIMKDPEVGIVGSKLLFADGTIQHAGMVFNEEAYPVHIFRSENANLLGANELREYPAVTAACMMLRTKEFLNLGGLETEYPMYYEDTDYCFKVRQSGKKIIYQPKSTLFHFEGKSSPNPAVAQALTDKSRPIFFRRWKKFMLGDIRVCTELYASGLPYRMPSLIKKDQYISQQRMNIHSNTSGWVAVTNDRLAESKPLKILFQNRASSRNCPGGDTVVMERLKEELEKRGHQVDFNSCLDCDLSEYDIVHLFNLILPELVEPFADNAVKQGKPFVIHAFQEDWPKYYTKSKAFAILMREYIRKDQAKDIFNDGIVLLQNLPLTPLQTSIQVSSQAEAVFCCGEYEAATVRNANPLAKTVINHYGAPLRKPNANAELFEQKFGVKDFVLCVGRLESRKNQLMLLTAMEDLDIPLVFADAGFTFSADYADLCKKFKRKGTTIFTGRLSEELLASAYCAAKVHALPSWYELPGLVSLEAAHYGCNVVASSWGAIESYLGKGCWYCEPDNIESVRAALISAYKAPRSYHDNSAISNFTWQEAAREVEQVYGQILQRNLKTVH